MTVLSDKVKANFHERSVVKHLWCLVLCAKVQGGIGWDAKRNDQEMKLVGRPVSLRERAACGQVGTVQASFPPGIVFGSRNDSFLWEVFSRAAWDGLPAGLILGGYFESQAGARTPQCFGCSSWRPWPGQMQGTGGGDEKRGLVLVSLSHPHSVPSHQNLTLAVSCGSLMGHYSPTFPEP